MNATAHKYDPEIIEMPYNWRPRDYQIPAWRALESGVKRAILFWHRRSGKDEICLHWAATQMMRRVGNYWHMLPEYAQARKSVWDAINPHTGIRRIDEAFPMQLRKRTNAQSMMIEFINGSTWQLVGSDSYNSLVGSPPIGVVGSEWALANPSAWGYLRPILRENGGWAIFITTPRGRNFSHKMYEGAKSDDDWYAELLTVDDTKIISQDDLKKERAEYQREYGDDDGDCLFRQEYYCDFDAALVGAYFSTQISDLYSNKRVCNLPYDPNFLVHTSWDLGVSDSTVIWFFQIVGHGIHLVDYYENNGQQLGHYVNVLREKKYIYGDHFFPHDVSVCDISGSGGMSRKETLESLGLSVSMIPRIKEKADAINGIRQILPRCSFDEKKTQRGLDCLAQYRRKWDEKLKFFHDRPLHDWTSHAVDAFDGMARSFSIASSDDSDNEIYSIYHSGGWMG